MNSLPSNSLQTSTPLSEPNPLSLDELFSRDPLKLSAQEIEAIVVALRKHYQQFQLDETKARSSGEKRVKTAKTKEQLQVDLNDILGDLKL